MFAGVEVPLFVVSIPGSTGVGATTVSCTSGVAAGIVVSVVVESVGVLFISSLLAQENNAVQVTVTKTKGKRIFFIDLVLKEYV